MASIRKCTMHNHSGTSRNRSRNAHWTLPIHRLDDVFQQGNLLVSASILLTLRPIYFLLVVCKSHLLLSNTCYNSVCHSKFHTSLRDRLINMRNSTKHNANKLTLIALTWPIFIEMLLHMLMGNADTFMLSQYSDESVAAVGVANQVMN